MKLKPKQKLLGSVLGLCLVALVVDRQFLGLSEAAAEMAPAEQYAVVREASPAVPAAAPAAEAPRGLAKEFDSIARSESLDLESVADAFAPSPAWQPRVEPVAEPAAPVTAAERFAAAHRLTATMAGSAAGCAIIDGRTLFVGQALDGFTLVEVSERSATFAGQDERFVLAVQEEATVR